jgi:hypothetical protein
MEFGGFMNPTLAKALVGLFPASILLLGSGMIFLRRRTTSSLLQVLGAGGLSWLASLTFVKQPTSCRE